jgi:hypothetical protein
VTSEGLSPYRVLILANAAALSDRQLEAIREFVRSGGTLLSDYQTSLFDEKAKQRRDFGLADVLGVHYRGLVPPPGAWLPVHGGPSFFDDVLEEVGEKPMERQWVAEGEAALSARVLATYQGKGRSIPALVLHQYGDGRSLYLSGYPGSKTVFRHKLAGTYNDFTDPFYRHLLEGTIARAVPEPYLVTDLPPEVIVNPLWCGDDAQPKLCLHLLNGLGSRPANGTIIPPGRAVDPHIGLGFPGPTDPNTYEGNFEVPFPPYQAPLVIRVRDPGLHGGYVVSPDFEGQQPVALTREGSYTVVTVPSLARYSIVVLDWAPPAAPERPPSQPDFESLKAPALPAAVAEEGSPTSFPSPLAAVAGETPTHVPASASVSGRSQRQEDDSYSTLTLPGWAVGAGVAFVAVVLIVLVGVWRSSAR